MSVARKLDERVRIKPRAERRNERREVVPINPRGMWPPDYGRIVQWRIQELLNYQRSPELLVAAKTFYKAHPKDFISDWCNTFDPRNAGKEDQGKLAHMPFVLFKRQEEFVDFLLAMLEADANGLVEKSRDMGVTWICACISVWLFLFHDGTSVGFGSRKAELVDKIGDMKSIFEKIRYVLRALPPCFLPEHFSYAVNMSHMKVYSFANGTEITGEGGDDIGRGGRTRLYVVDEAAHLEHPESVEASLSNNTSCRIDVSSVNGLGNVFQRKRAAGQLWMPGVAPAKDRVNVFVFDWTDHPGKSKQWYDEQRASALGAGLLHVFASEVERNYAASVSGTIIPAVHVLACIDAHVRLGLSDDGPWVASLDIADGGGDTNAFGKRKGIVLRHVEEWGARDTGVTTRRAISQCEHLGRLSLQYDAVGMGSNVRAEANRLRDDGLMPKYVTMVPWFASGKVIKPDGRVNPHDPQSPLNKDFFKNLKAQGWFELARRCERTYRAIRQLDDPSSEPDFTFDPDDLISIDSKLGSALIQQIRDEMSQPVWGDDTKLKRIVDKTPEGTKSPNIGDMIMMLYWPAAIPMFAIPDTILGVLQNTRRR